MRKIIYYIAIVALVLSISSCDEKEDFEQINSSVVEVAGEWWVKYSTDGYESDYTKLLTFNTAADNGQEFWISDENNWWWYKTKCPVNTENMTFSGSDLENTIYEVTIQVNGGKIIENVVHTPSGAIADSIYFEIEFGDDAGTIYQAAGFRKTGFLEDEH